MAHCVPSVRLTRWSGIPFTLASLLALGVAPSLAQTLGGDFALCARGLRSRGLSDEAIAAACALAYRPTEVSGCVAGVLNRAAVDPTVALAACSRDRRPLEVAACFSAIHGTLPISDSPAVLDHCHRSILPVRYGQCVTDLATTLNLGPEAALAQCIAAGYRPENVAPTFIFTR